MSICPLIGDGFVPAGVEPMEVDSKAAAATATSGDSASDLENSSHYRNDNKRQRVSVAGWVTLLFC